MLAELKDLVQKGIFTQVNLLLQSVENHSPMISIIARNQTNTEEADRF